MKHRIFGKKLGRNAKQRTALFRSLSASFVHHGFIETSLPKAKAVQPIIEKLVTKIKKDTAKNYRLIHAFLRDSTTAQQFVQAVSLLPKKQSGFTRIERVGIRKGDATPMVRLEWAPKHDQKT